MTKKEIINGLKFTIEMFLFNPSTGETRMKESLNVIDRTTVEACEGAIKFLSSDHFSEWGELTDSIMNVPSVSGDDWIPCDVKEPEEDQICWVTAKTTTERVWHGIFTKRYGERRDCGFICNDGFMWWNTALAWKPYVEPAPYQPKEDSK